MCGINGIVNFISPVGKELSVVKKMNNALVHRGPDGEGTFVSKNGNVVFGHRRLSIVDVEGGKQPIIYNHNKSEYVITYNGEIFNYKSLRKGLEGKGYKFKTKSDTEVLLVSYIEWGKNCLEKLNGQFAFVIYDENKNSVFLARDRVGIKPLYYAILQNGTLLFSSEPKGILANPKFQKEPDNETIADFFLCMITLTDGSAALNRSFFKGMFSLNPGTYAYFDKKGLKNKKYWDVPIEDKKKDKDVYSRLRKQLERAVLDRFAEEVKFGTALSGGIDSSIITSIAADNFDGKLTSSTIKFEGVDNNPDFQHAKLLAKQKRLDLLTTALTPKKMMHDVDMMIKAMDEPHDTIRQLGMFANYRTLHEAKCKVVLVGEGADEFNLGYYYTSPGFAKDKEEISSSKKFRDSFAQRVPLVSQYFTKEFLESINFDEIIDFNVSNYYDACESKEPLDKMQYFYAKKFLKYRLDANDRCSMAYSVEARVPFCDHEVVEISLGVTPKLNLKDGTEKFVLRKAFGDTLPKEILERRKYPLPESEDVEMYQLIADELQKNINSAHPKVFEILNKEYVSELNAKFKQKIEDIKNGGKNNLTQEIALSEEEGLRVKHIFSILTFLRWFEINFV